MRQNPFWMALRVLVFLVAVGVLNFPFITTLVTSFKSNAEVSVNPALWIDNPTIENYFAIFAMRDRFDILHYLGNSIVSAGFGALLATALAFPAAYAIVRHEVGEKWLMPVVTNLRAIPLIIFSIPIYLVYQQVHLLDTKTGLALILCLVNLPLVLALIVNGIRAVPFEVEEAARVDGAGTFAILFRIVLPMAAPAIASSLILAFIYSWNEFLFGLILTTQNAVPMTVGASFFFAASGGGVQWGIASAVMVLSSLPPLAISLVFYRYIGRSLAAGAVKG